MILLYIGAVICLFGIIGLLYNIAVTADIFSFYTHRYSTIPAVGGLLLMYVYILLDSIK